MLQPKPALTIYISNMSEDVWPFISAMSSPYDREVEIQENAKLSEHDLFSFIGIDNLLMIVPRYPDKIYLKYFRDNFAGKNFNILSTQVHTGEICKDILKDKEIMDEIKKISHCYENVHLISYCCSTQFLELSKLLNKTIPNIILSESPEFSDSWTVDFYGSKSGIRQLSQMHGAHEPDFRMAEGLISVGIANSVKIAANMYTKNGGIVVKTNKGHSGAGVLIFRPRDLPPDFASCEKAIYPYLDKERYWRQFPIILEKYIEPYHPIGGGYPNVEFRIHKNGKIEFLYYCACRLTDQGVFKGIIIHNDVLSDKVAAQIVDTGFFIGEQYAKQGYRGYFDVDFIAGKNGELYVSESNTRRTGGTHVYYTARKLFGKDFMYETYAISNNTQKTPKSLTLGSEDLFTLLAPILFTKKRMEGIVITGTSLLDQKAFGYIIFAKNKTRALTIERRMSELLGF